MRDLEQTTANSIGQFLDQKPKTIPTLKEFAGYPGGKGGICYVTEYLYLRVL